MLALVGDEGDEWQVNVISRPTFCSFKIVPFCFQEIKGNVYFHNLIMLYNLERQFYSYIFILFTVVKDLA